MHLCMIIWYSVTAKLIKPSGTFSIPTHVLVCDTGTTNFIFLPKVGFTNLSITSRNIFVNTHGYPIYVVRVCA